MMGALRWKFLLVMLGVCLVAGTAGAANITIDDGMTPNATWGVGATGQGGEDQEVESGCLMGQEWDVEGMFLTGTTLALVGGWDFENGLSDPQYPNNPDDHHSASGDIFIATGDAPTYGEDAAGVTSSKMSAYGYDYVIDVNWLAGTYTVFSDSDNHLVDTVTEANNQAANPYRRESGGEEITSAAGNFTSYGYEGDDPLPTEYANEGFDGTDYTDGSHAYNKEGTPYDAEGQRYAVTFDLGWLDDILGTSQDEVWFHFTEQCGNDSAMGNVTDWSEESQVVVPEPASMGLLGFGLFGLLATRIRRKRL